MSSYTHSDAGFTNVRCGYTGASCSLTDAFRACAADVSECPVRERRPIGREIVGCVIVANETVSLLEDTTTDFGRSATPIEPDTSSRAEVDLPTS